jgi:hypothetical protein
VKGRQSNDRSDQATAKPPSSQLLQLRCGPFRLRCDQASLDRNEPGRRAEEDDQEVLKPSSSSVTCAGAS